MPVSPEALEAAHLIDRLERLARWASSPGGSIPLSGTRSGISRAPTVSRARQRRLPTILLRRGARCRGRWPHLSTRAMCRGVQARATGVRSSSHSLRRRNRHWRAIPCASSPQTSSRQPTAMWQICLTNSGAPLGTQSPATMAARSAPVSHAGIFASASGYRPGRRTIAACSTNPFPKPTAAPSASSKSRQPLHSWIERLSVP